MTRPPATPSDWLKLDNAAKIYPSVSPLRSPAVFRMGVLLIAPVKLWLLQQALERTMQRCPYYRVHLRRGFFWYYLQQHEHTPRVQLLGGTVPPLPPRAGHMLRVLARGNSVAVDFSHILTDGSGGLRFLLTLLANYLRLGGTPVAEHEALLNGDTPNPREYEDAHRLSFRDETPQPPTLGRAWHTQGRLLPLGSARVLHGQMSTSALLGLCRAAGVSLTEYLTALYLHCLTLLHDATRGHHKRPVIRLEVPVNMRALYPSPTMRNFSLYVSPEVDRRLAAYSFDELLKRVHHSLRMQIDSRELSRHFARNVGAELNPLVRFMPLPVKDAVLSMVYSAQGEDIYSGVLSNMGAVNLPPELEPLVAGFRFVIPPNRVMKQSCTVVSHRDNLCVTFSSLLESREPERLFYSHLAAQGVHVSIFEEP